MSNTTSFHNTAPSSDISVIEYNHIFNGQELYSGGKEEYSQYSVMFEPGDNCHLHTGTIISRGPHSQHPTLPVQHVLHTYNQHLPHSATMAHQGGMAQTPHRYRLVRQYSNDALAQTSSQMSGGVTKAWPGMGSVSTQSSPTHLALQPAYSSPHVYSSQANIYAEVETDYEMDSGFTEESVSDSLGDKKEDSVYNNYTNSSCSSEAGPYLREVAHSQGRLGFGPGHSRAPVTMTVSRAGATGTRGETLVSDKNGKIFSISSRTLQTKPLVPPYDPRYNNIATTRGGGTHGPDKHNQIHV